MDRVLIHIVVYKDYQYLEKCLHAVRELEGPFERTIEVTRNGPLDGEDESLRQLCSRFEAKLFEYESNLGFCGAHNAAAARCLNGEFTHFLVLNPDLALKPTALGVLLQKCDDRSAFVCPLLIRANEELKPEEPQKVDSAGMVFTRSLRHFDRYAEKLVANCTLEEEEVCGGSGACLLFSRQGLRQLLIKECDHEALFQVFPELESGFEERSHLFDEAFFAYREDAELSLRARSLGLSMKFVPDAVGYHVRRVTPERRSELSSEINRHSVRNRFLLQVLHWSPFRQSETIIPGFIFRNLLVLFGVLIFERSSLRGLWEFIVLFPRAWRIRQMLYKGEMHA